jgi:hypothetical protein
LAEECQLVGPSDPDICFDVYEQGTNAILLIFIDPESDRPIWQTAGTYSVVFADLRGWLTDSPADA